MITAAIPLWKGANILWLQLESLCRQVTTEPWEVMLYECESKAGWDVLASYDARLRKAGCESVGYMHSKERRPLGEKWRAIAQEVRSEVYMLCAADNYSPPDRVQQAHDAISQGYDWTDTSSGLFYDIPTRRQATWTRPGNRSGLWMATRTEYVRNLEGDGPPRGVDAWMRKQIPNNRYHRDMAMGVHTDGANTISKRRRGRYTGRIQKPFVRARQDVTDIIPPEVMGMFRSARMAA